MSLTKVGTDFKVRVKSRSKKGSRSDWFAVFRCSCGEMTIKNSSEVRRGCIGSCGCKSRSTITANRDGYFKSVGISRHGMTNTGTYGSWSKMRERCLNKNHDAYSNYGGRGISICERWNSFVLFLEDMGERPDGMTLDRIRPNEGYCKDNCRWATHEEQSANQRTCINITYNGQTHSTGKWARIMGVGDNTIRRRLHNGWPIEEVINGRVSRRWSGK